MKQMYDSEVLKKWEEKDQKEWKNMVLREQQYKYSGRIDTVKPF
jgi:hypothetical protein